MSKQTATFGMKSQGVEANGRRDVVRMGAPGKSTGWPGTLVVNEKG
jgi:hypothetical protein